jgi:hypothetical protein
MASRDSVVLTDVANGVWVDQLSLSEQSGLKLSGSSDWSLTKRTLRGGLSDGVDVVEIDNGALSVSVLPTRGMGLWRANYNGFELGWKSPVRQPVHPAFVNLTERSGLGWLAGFNELMCRCGLASHGAPGNDVVIDNRGNKLETPLTLHGKIANCAAHRVEVAVATDGDGTLSITGEVDEAMLFGPCLRLRSTLSSNAGSNRFRVVDEVTNLAGQSAEMELLYHTNLGGPLLEEGARVIAAVEEVAPSNARAVEGIGHWQIYDKPTPGFTEQVYFLQLLSDDTGETVVLLTNAAEDQGVSLRFNRSELPYFTLWKNTQAVADGYVTGLEPGTSLPNLKTFEREQERVVQLKPGESYKTSFELAVHCTKQEVAGVRKEIGTLQGETAPVVHAQPVAKFSPGA